MSAVPEHFTLAMSEEQIKVRVREIGLEVGSWAKSVNEQGKKQVLAVCILRGAVHFFSDLLRAVPETLEPAFCRTWSYSSVQNEKLVKSGEAVERGGDQAVRVSIDDIVAEGRHILLLDDICDSGATLERLSKLLLDMGAAEVRSAVLIRRTDEQGRFKPDYVCFEYPGVEWFVGYGMEDRDHYSNLPAVYTIPPAT